MAGPDAAAFSVSPERAAGSVDVQVLVRAPELVNYETKTVMLVQVRAALGRPGATVCPKTMRSVLCTQ